MQIFEIEDRWHSESQGEFETFDLAMTQIKRRTAIPWNEPPNRAPCTSWRTCGRLYEIREFNVYAEDWTLVKNTSVVEIDHAGVRWRDMVE